MPTLLSQAVELPPFDNPPRKRWTREQCAALESAGLFGPERLELVNGELISKMGKNRPHVNSLMLMVFWLVETFGREFVDSEAPIDVSPLDNPSNEPQPDIIVRSPERANSCSSNPQPQEIRLLVEISDSTLNYDLSVKAPLYARAGIVEYWVLDVNKRRLFCHRNPVSGTYQSVTVYSEHESLAPLAAPAASFSPVQAFPN